MEGEISSVSETLSTFSAADEDGAGCPSSEGEWAETLSCKAKASVLIITALHNFNWYFLVTQQLKNWNSNPT
jgi:hypothetical protein